MHSFLVALALLTVVHIRLRKLPSAEVVGRSRWWYPVVGILLGCLLGGWTAFLAARELGTPLAAFLVLLAWVLVTGALHLDGLCDLCDGLFGGRTPEDRLRILKDPHLGTFGLAGGVLLLLGKFVLLGEAIALWHTEAGWTVGLAVAAARCLVLCLAAGAHYPRPEGTGKALVEAVRGWEVLPFAGAAAALGVLVGPLPGLAAVLAAFLAVMPLRVVCVRRLGGITGDCLGAGIELAEVVILLTMILLARA